VLHFRFEAAAQSKLASIQYFPPTAEETRYPSSFVTESSVEKALSPYPSD
jgi:hypothetical protein